MLLCHKVTNKFFIDQLYCCLFYKYFNRLFKLLKNRYVKDIKNGRSGNLNCLTFVKSPLFDAWSGLFYLYTIRYWNFWLN